MLNSLRNLLNQCNITPSDEIIAAARSLLQAADYQPAPVGPHELRQRNIIRATAQMLITIAKEKEENKR